ncbi:MAG TPA: DUF222 domain-containing protein, partial [Acidimicrobiales bacterium]|nr:DUF222 domain-containing protein [Acidimicrobiales bacterium]
MYNEQMFPSSVVDEPAVLSSQELRDRVVEGWAEQASHLAWWLSLVAELDRREAWAGDGLMSCAHWLSWQCAIDMRTARAHVQVARCLDELPLLREAFATGRVSYSKVRAVCRVATRDNEVLLVELAQNLTAAQLERTVANYARSQ